MGDLGGGFLHAEVAQVRQASVQAVRKGWMSWDTWHRVLPLRTPLTLTS